MELWNQHSYTKDGLACTKDGLAGTNNSVEGWNGAIAKALGPAHPNMWKLLSQFQIEACKTLVTAEQLSVGDYKKTINKNYTKNNKAILTLVSDYDNNEEKMDFIKKIGRHISTFASL